MELREYARDKQHAVAAAAIILITVFFVQRLCSGAPLSKFPLIGREYGNSIQRTIQFVKNARVLYDKAYRELGQSIFRVTSFDGERLVLPYKYLTELRAMSDEEIDIRKHQNIMLENNYTAMVAEGDLINHVVRADLTPALPKLSNRMSDVAEQAISKEIPSCEDWTSLPINQILLRVVSIISGSVFVGPELCWNEEYLYSSVYFTLDFVYAIRALKILPKFLRPIVAPFLPELKKLGAHRIKMAKFLGPVVEARKEAEANGQEVPFDVLQWIINKSEKFDANSIEKQASAQLTLIFGAIHTSSTTVTNMYVTKFLSLWPCSEVDVG
jgi:hypothetical protein